MLGLLKELITRNPFVDEVDFSNEGIQYFDPHSVDLLGRFTELRKINLSDNEIRKLPNDLSCLNQIVELNLTGNPIENLQLAVESLMTMPVLSSLHINLHQEEEVDFLLRNLPALQVLNGLIVERDAIFSEDEDCVNTDRPLSDTTQSQQNQGAMEFDKNKQDDEVNEADDRVITASEQVQSPQTAPDYQMEVQPHKPSLSSAMPEPTLSSSSPKQSKRPQSQSMGQDEPYSMTELRHPETHQLSQSAVGIGEEQLNQNDGGSVITQQNQLIKNSALVAAVRNSGATGQGSYSGNTVAASIQANIQHETSNIAVSKLQASDQKFNFCHSYDNRQPQTKQSKHNIGGISDQEINMGDQCDDEGDDYAYEAAVSQTQQRLVASCHTQHPNEPKKHIQSQATAAGQQFMLSQQSQGDRQSDIAANNMNNYNRSSLLVLSSSKEDEDERVPSQVTAGAQVVDPKTLIQFKELEQESFNFSRQGMTDNLLNQQLSNEDVDYTNGGEGMINFTRRADNQLDILSLDDASQTLQTSGNLLKSIPQRKDNNPPLSATAGNQNIAGSYGGQFDQGKHGHHPIVGNPKGRGICSSGEKKSKNHHLAGHNDKFDLINHLQQQQQDSSSVDTELEVSINNAHLLTNLAKAVQEKERHDMNKLGDHELCPLFQMNDGKQQTATNKNSASGTKAKYSGHADQQVSLREDLWLFAYEEQAEQACAQHDTEGTQRMQRENLRAQKQFPTQGTMLDNLIRDATSLAQLSSETVFTQQVEELLTKVKQGESSAQGDGSEDLDGDENNADQFEEKARNKSQLLNVAFGSILHHMKEGSCSQELSNVVGLLHWFSAGLLEGSLRAYEHLKEKQTAQLEQLKQKHQAELTRLQAELQDVLEAAETFEKQALKETEQKERASEQFSKERQEYEEQLMNLQEENKKLLDTLIRHSKDRANKSISQSMSNEPQSQHAFNSNANHNIVTSQQAAAPSASINSDMNSISINEPESQQLTPNTGAGGLNAQNYLPAAPSNILNHNSSLTACDMMVDGDIDSQSNLGQQQDRTMTPLADYPPENQLQINQNHFKGQTPLSNISQTDASMRHFNNGRDTNNNMITDSSSLGNHQQLLNQRQSQQTVQLVNEKSSCYDEQQEQQELMQKQEKHNLPQPAEDASNAENLVANNPHQNNQSWSYNGGSTAGLLQQNNSRNGFGSNGFNNSHYPPNSVSAMPYDSSLYDRSASNALGVGGFQRLNQYSTQLNQNMHHSTASETLNNHHYLQSNNNNGYQSQTQNQYASVHYASSNQGAQYQQSQAVTSIGQKLIPIKQLKDIISDIYNQKLKFDAKSRQSGLPVETMEQFMYTYLVQKYGLKTLIVEWATAIINGVRAYAREDHEIALFAKVLKNECDEEFRYIQVHVKSTLEQVLKAVYRDKHPLKSEKDLNSMVEKLKKHNGIGQVEEAIWKKLILKMYDTSDSQNLIQKAYELIEAKREAKENEFSANFFTRGINQSNLNNLVVGGMQPTRKLTREQENAKRKQIKLESRIRFQELSDLILEYQLLEHENFLSKFTYEFKMVDTEALGVLNEHQFKQLIANMHRACDSGGLFSFEQDVDAEIDELLEGVDPQNNQRITYSEIVQLLSQRTVPCYPNNEITVAIVSQEARQMPILEKFVQYAQCGNTSANENNYFSQDGLELHAGSTNQADASGDLLMHLGAEQEIDRRLSQVSNSNAESARSSNLLAYEMDEEEEAAAAVDDSTTQQNHENLMLDGVAVGDVDGSLGGGEDDGGPDEIATVERTRLGNARRTAKAACKCKRSGSAGGTRARDGSRCADCKSSS